MHYISARGRGSYQNYHDMLKRYVLNAYTAILLFILYVNINVNVNMLIRISRSHMWKNTGVSVLCIIFMFVCVIKIYCEKNTHQRFFFIYLYSSHLDSL